MHMTAAVAYGFVESPDHERRQIVDYLRTQARDEMVEHAEKVASERVFEREYNVWDVHTATDRWWVVTCPTNLYNQRDFKSMDGVISFHIGLTARVLAKSARTAPSDPDPRFQRARRQWEQAADAQNEADEAEEFQAVGMRCRETLISFAQGVATDELVPAGDEHPRSGDFVHWSELIASAVAVGTSAARLRSYLRTLAKETWDYVSWLTHAKNATIIDSELAMQMTGHLLAMFELAIERKERGATERCPLCGSYRLTIDEHFDEETDDFMSVRLCEACEWSQEFEPDHLHAVPSEPGEVRGACLPSSEL
jgi:hypothetical protein